MAEASTSSLPAPLPASTTADPPAQTRAEPIPNSYTIAWAARNTKDDPHYIKLAPYFGDGNQDRWPEEGPDMTLLDNDHEKQRMWRKTAGELIAKDLGHFNNDTAAHWMLADLPRGYALFQQVTHPKNDTTQREGGKRLRLDRFIFGHDGRKIRSALSLGKHISWQLFGKVGICGCDGCKTVARPVTEGSPAKPPRKRKATGEGEAGDESGELSAKGRARAGGRAVPRGKAGKGKGKGGKGKGKDWDDDGDEDFGMYDDYGAYDDEEGDFSSDYGRIGGRTASGRQPKPSSKVVSALQDMENVVDDISTHMTAAPPKVTLIASTVHVERVQQDLRLSGFPRVGELVWCRVPLEKPPYKDANMLGNADFSRWPAIVQERNVKRDGDKTDVKYSIELLAMAKKDTLLNVRAENVIPWLSLIPVSTKQLDEGQTDWEGVKPNGEKKGWGDIQTEGWPGVVGAFRRAHRIAKCYAGIQVRSLPLVAIGPHLSAAPDVPPTTLASLKQNGPRSRYLSYSHVLYGPEIIHSGDFVRLVPGVSLGPLFDYPVADPTVGDHLPLSLILHISLIYRGGANSPLIVRGQLYEMIEIPTEDDPAFASRPDAYKQELPLSALKTIPRPFPAHKWRLLTGTDEVDVLFSDVAGRYYELSKERWENPETFEWAMRKVRHPNQWPRLQVWGRGEMGYGINGIDALTLMLCGLCAGPRTVRIIANNGAAGGRTEQLAIAEEQAIAEIAVEAKETRPGDDQVMDVDPPVETASKA